MTKIILFNGPPGSGKDTAADMAYEETDLVPLLKKSVKFAKAVKESVHQMLDLVDPNGMPYSHDFFESAKNEKMAAFRGFSPRETYIWYSEEVMKPRYGTAIFGEILADQIGPGSQKMAVFVSDSGFREEAEVLLDRYGVPAVTLVRMHRTGCNFDKDSRSYLDLSDWGVETFDIRNDGTLEQLQFEISNLLFSLDIPQIERL